MTNNNNYKLVGTINIFGIYPDFVYPVFENNGKHYFQHSENNIIDYFIEASKNKRFNIIRYSEIDSNMNIKDIYTIGDKPIFAFQTDKSNIFISELDNFIEFISNIETEDYVLIEQISEFIDEVNLRKIQTKKKKYIKESNI